MERDEIIFMGMVTGMIPFGIIVILMNIVVKILGL